MEFTLRKEKQPQIRVGGTPRVDLLPNEVTQQRVQRQILKSWALRIGGALAIVALVCVGLFGWQAASVLQLTAVRAEGQTLVSQISTKSDIQAILAAEQTLTGLRGEATATQLSWSKALGKIHSALPAEAWVCSFSLTVGGAPSGEPEQGIGLAGNVDVCGSFPSAIPFLHDIESVDGVSRVTIVSSQWEDEISAYRHTILVQLDQTIYEAEATQ